MKMLGQWGKNARGQGVQQGENKGISLNIQGAKGSLNSGSREHGIPLAEPHWQPVHITDTFFHILQNRTFSGHENLANLGHRPFEKFAKYSCTREFAVLQYMGHGCVQMVIPMAIMMDDRSSTQELLLSSADAQNILNCFKSVKKWQKNQQITSLRKLKLYSLNIP